MDNELEQFRKSWKDELISSKTGESEKQNGGVASASAEPTPSGSKPGENNHVIEPQQGLSNIDKVRKQPNTLEPFLLAERLLEQSNFSKGIEHSYQKSRRRSSASDDSCFANDSDRKRRKEERKDGQSKKENSFLDVFLADLVSVNLN